MLDKTILKIEVSETDRSREYWATRPWVGPEVISDIRTSSILLVPWENRKPESPSFPQGTSEIFTFLKDNLGENPPAIGILPENYAELALHSRRERFPTVLATLIALPILVNVASDWIARSSTSTDMIEIEIIVEREDYSCISIKYDGPKKDFKVIVDREIDDHVRKSKPQGPVD